MSIKNNEISGSVFLQNKISGNVSWQKEISGSIDFKNIGGEVISIGPIGPTGPIGIIGPTGPIGTTGPIGNSTKYITSIFYNELGLVNNTGEVIIVPFSGILKKYYGLFQKKNQSESLEINVSFGCLKDDTFELESGSFFSSQEKKTQELSNIIFNKNDVFLVLIENVDNCLKANIVFEFDLY